jgi:hypothetical protein
MSLTCGFNELELEPGQVAYYYPEDFEILNTKRRRKCTSCGELIEIGSFVVPVHWFKVPYHEIEVNIYGEDGEIPRASTYLCETCGEIHLNLLDLGYHVNYDDDMRVALGDYHKTVKAQEQAV